MLALQEGRSDSIHQCMRIWSLSENHVELWTPVRFPTLLYDQLAIPYRYVHVHDILRELEIWENQR